MTVNTRALLESKFAENAQTTQITSDSGTNTIIDKFTGTNVTGSTATLSVNVVVAAGTAGSSNLIVQLKSLAAGECYTFPEIVGQVLGAGDFISTIAGTASAIVIRGSGRKVT